MSGEQLGVSGQAIRHVMFIDDNTRNVEGARTAGFAAEQWCLDDGHDALRDLLARHGVSAL